MSIDIPDRLHANTDDPVLKSLVPHIRVWLDDVERPRDVVEYCISEGWITVHSRDPRGNLRMERGRLVGIKKHGKVRVELEQREAIP